MDPDDEVRFVLQARGGFALVALADRVLIAKYGMGTGVVGGGRLGDYKYRDLTSSHFHTGLFGVIELRARDGSLPCVSSGYSIIEIGECPHVLICAAEDIQTWQTYLAELEGLIRDAGGAVEESASSGSADASTDSGGLTDQLERLASLHRDGLLTAEEYAAAKSRLLG